jgi:hypothetical protein
MLGLGTLVPLEVKGANNSDTILTVTGGTTAGLGSNAKIKLVPDGTAGLGVINVEGSDGSDVLAFETNGSEAMRIDSSGNLLVGQSTYSVNNGGIRLRQDGEANFSRSDQPTIFLNRVSSDGEIARFTKDGAPVGSIGVQTTTLGVNPYIAGSGGRGLSFDVDTTAIFPCSSTGARADGSADLGASTARFDDIYATNGTIQTSDRNEKQDIAELSDAEQRVAVAAKGLLRKFRWKDAVAEKGDEARTHFGIIAQGSTSSICS